MVADGRFKTTQWSVIVAASQTRADPASHEALESLCRNYWYPVFAFIQRSGRSREDALDLTQGYFTVLMEKGLLRAADRERGRFRSFLLATVKQFLSDERKRDGALKRGGAASFVSLTAASDEERDRSVADERESPEQAFERQWAMTVFRKARRNLAREFEESGKQDHYRLLEGHLSGDRAARSYAEIADELGLSEGAIKMAVQRLRKRFGRLLREEIAQTVVDETDLDAEVRHLLAVI